MTHPLPERRPPHPGARPAGPGAAPAGGSASRPRRAPGGVERTYQLTRPERLDLETFARATGTHPELVRRLVALGLLDAGTDSAGHLWFPPPEVLTMARIRRLRAGFSINYAALGLVLDLLDRIAQLEAAQRGRSRLTGGSPWT